jgi:hypothetical protein
MSLFDHLNTDSPLNATAAYMYQHQPPTYWAEVFHTHELNMAADTRSLLTAQAANAEEADGAEAAPSGREKGPAADVEAADGVAAGLMECADTDSQLYNPSSSFPSCAAAASQRGGLHRQDALAGNPTTAGSDVTAAASIAHPTSHPPVPLEASYNDHAAVIGTHSFCLQRATNDTRRCVELVHQLRDALTKDHNVSVLHNGTRQYQVSTLHGPHVEKLRAELNTLWAKVARAAIRAAGLQERAHLVDVKLMIAQPRQPAQEVHWDSPRGPDEPDKYSIILYCTQTMSTAVPLFSNQRSLSTPGLDAVERRTIFSLLKKNPYHYHSVTVQPGDVLVMQQSVPHYAPRHLGKGERIVLYDMMSDDPNVLQDDYPHYEKQYRTEALK